MTFRLVVLLFFCSGCLTPRIERDPDASQAPEAIDNFFDQFEGALAPGPPPDCDNAIFARTYAHCPTPEATFPMIWDALAPSLTREGAAAFVGARRARLDRCCADSEVVLEVDLVVACDGAVSDARVQTHASLLPRWRQLCVRDEVKSWKLDRPERHEQGIHFIVTCGARRR